MAPKIFALNGLKQTDRQTQKRGRNQAFPLVRHTFVSTETPALPDPQLLLAALRAEHVCWRAPCAFCALLNNDPISDDALRALVADGPGTSTLPNDPIVEVLGQMLAWLQAGARERHQMHQQVVSRIAARHAARARLAAHVPELDDRARRLRVAMCTFLEKSPAKASVARVSQRREPRR
jgi:hypothetical protein